VVICLEQGEDCLHMVQLMPLHPKIPSSFTSFKCRLVLPFWYRLIEVVLKKKPLNGCVKVITKHNRQHITLLTAIVICSNSVNHVLKQCNSHFHQHTIQLVNNLCQFMVSSNNEAHDKIIPAGWQSLDHMSTMWFPSL